MVDSGTEKVRSEQGDVKARSTMASLSTSGLSTSNELLFAATTADTHASVVANEPSIAAIVTTGDNYDVQV